MAKYDSNQYVEIFYKLPPEIKDAVSSSETTNHLWKIGEKHSLHIDKIGVMTDIAFDVMMGIVSSRAFAAELQKELGIDALDAGMLARDIDENVFKPIKKTMVDLYGDKAPNKPGSSLVQFTEDDEEHAALSKDTLLKEIEDPHAAVARVEASSVTGQAVSASLKAPEMVMSASTELETEEEVKTLHEMEEKIPIPAASAAVPSILDKLAEMKLSQAFVMPKNGDMSTATPQMPVKAPAEEIKLAAPATTSAPRPNATPPVSHEYPVDPYREPLN